MVSFGDYSVLMSVYAKDKPEWLITAIDSMLSQTVQAKEFIIVIDGPVGDDLDAVLRQYELSDPRFIIIALEENCGLPTALNIGLRNCSFPHVARMDADDYSEPTRCEKELELINREHLDFVGTNVDEFCFDIDNPISRILLPENYKEIQSVVRRRCPMRHPTMMLTKEAVNEINGYDPDLLNGQDYDLVARLLLAGYKCKNIQEPLVKMRVSDDFYRRRGGINYFRRIMALKKKLYCLGLYSRFDYLLGICVHFISCMLPNSLREILYKRILRSDPGYGGMHVDRAESKL